jgi:hypothetical protein
MLKLPALYGVGADYQDDHLGKRADIAHDTAVLLGKCQLNGVYGRGCGLLEVGFEFEEVFGGFGYIEETRIDRFGMMILVPRWFSFSSSASPSLVGIEKCVGVVGDVVSDRGVNAAVVKPRLSTLTDCVPVGEF